MIYYGMIIYKLTHKTSGKCYIGQTVRDFELRWKEHCDPKRVCSAIGSAIQKYGLETFSKEVIGAYNNLEDLNNAEIYFIEWHNSVSPNGYNLMSGGEGGIPNEETKNKLVKSHLGIIPSEETRRKMGNASRGRKHSEKTITKLRSLRENMTPILCLNNGIIYFFSMRGRKAIETKISKH